MCLIALARNVAPEYPLIIAANRDEDYDRPALRAHHWTDAPHILGGRDVTHGGSWLAISCDGRFAAVTNLRGARTQARSRGLLVKDFVLGGAPVSSPAQYGGFNLITGTVGGTASVTSNATEATMEIPDGVYAIENDPPGVVTPKLTHALDEMRRIVSEKVSRETLTRELFDFLRTPGAFVAADRYGTRAATVIIATAGGIVLSEQTYGRRGVPDGPMIELRCR